MEHQRANIASAVIVVRVQDWEHHGPDDYDGHTLM